MARRLIYLAVRTDPHRPRHRGISVLVTPLSTPGIESGGSRCSCMGETPSDEARARWVAWSGTTLAYLAGLASASLALAVEHARTREQFGAPLAALPQVQSRLARAAVAVDGMALLAWASADAGVPLPVAELTWAAATASDIAASAHQVHGAVGFALEPGLHRFSRRATSMQAWIAAVCAVAR